jgi:hypothetical protein
MAIASAGGTANASSFPAIQVQAAINGVGGDILAANVPTSAALTISAPFASLVTGLGSSFTVEGLAISTGSGAFVTGSCSIRISATIVFLR